MSATSTTDEAPTSSERVPPDAYPAEKARGGEIILKTKWARAIFLTGLFGGIVVVAAVAIYLGIFG
ncbi:hypothetical protein AUC71_06945 [Methyloceanibacter marginalis]|jgi:hypothetical protein|uniref:Peptide ABC transporter permease n=1 Tax=Methyloceanibacter marginalis TaxID=1774971 RepID=A0A1E3WDW9_9HYPH|nr:hypothetical protein [Methyloceanibacter marginalis]ODS03950.1 hypothetical protein AUC71_06945 [Methyloceanibacter marginalis]